MSEEMSIKILGSGCKKCKALLNNTNEAVKEMNIEAKVEYITDIKEIVTYNVLQMPALLINDKVVSKGTVLTTKNIEKIISEYK